MASEEDSRVVAVEGFVAAIVDSEVVVVSAVAVIATVTETAATARQTDSARLLMLLPAQVPVVVLGVIVVTDTALVGMTRAAAVAHMMTDPVDATAADSATGTDVVAPTLSPSVSAGHESLATTTDPEMTTAGSADTKAATRTPENSGVTSHSRYQDTFCFRPTYLARHASVVGIFRLYSQFHTSCQLAFPSPFYHQG